MTKPIEIYTTKLCGYCRLAKTLLQKKRLPFTEHDVSFRPKARAAMAERAQGRSSVPQIFIGDYHIGGCDDLFDLERSGELDKLLS